MNPFKLIITLIIKLNLFQVLSSQVGTLQDPFLSNFLSSQTFFKLFSFKLKPYNIPSFQVPFQTSFQAKSFQNSFLSSWSLQISLPFNLNFFKLSSSQTKPFQTFKFLFFQTKLLFFKNQIVSSSFLFKLNPFKHFFFKWNPFKLLSFQKISNYLKPNHFKFSSSFPFKLNLFKFTSFQVKPFQSPFLTNPTFINSFHFKPNNF